MVGMEYEIDIEKRKSAAVWRKNVTCNMHIQRDMEIVFVTVGRLKMMIGGIEYTVDAGQALFVEPYEPHAFLRSNENQCCIIEFKPEMARELFKQLQNHTADPRVLTLDRRVIDYLLYLLPENVEYNSDVEYANYIDEVYMQTIVDVMCHEFLCHCDFHHAQKQYDDLYISALLIISRNLDQRLTLSYVAHQLGICPETLCRKFSEHAHMSFAKYIKYVRVHRAATLLREEISITDAAMSAGFGSISSFNSAFKQIIGVTPSEYRMRENQKA